MAQTEWRWRHLAAVAALVAGSATVVSLAQSSADNWWPGYGNGPDNSRYFAVATDRQVQRHQLQVAWTYPFGDTGSTRSSSAAWSMAAAATDRSSPSTRRPARSCGSART